MVPRWPPGVVLLLTGMALISSCLNDYDQFEARGSVVDPQVGGGAEAGAAGAASGAGGVAGEGGAGGAAGGAAGEGGAAGAPLVCEEPTVACGDVCADTSSDEEHCGSCGNSCTSQSIGFECTSGLCGCTSLEHCGSDNAERSCEAGRCLCNGVTCAPGEICGRRGNQFICRCNGGEACQAGTTCCESPRGCFDLQADPSNCGTCGRSCAMGESCSLGQCGPSE